MTEDSVKENENGEQKTIEQQFTEHLVKLIEEKVGGNVSQSSDEIIQSDDFAIVVIKLVEGFMSDNFDDYLENTDTSLVENWFEYNAESYVSDWIQEWMSYNFCLSDYDDGSHDVQGQVENWIEHGCDTVDDYALKLVGRARTSVERNVGKESAWQSKACVILTRDEYDRIMEVVDFIRPQVEPAPLPPTNRQVVDGLVAKMDVAELQAMIAVSISDKAKAEAEAEAAKAEAKAKEEAESE